MLFTWHAHLFLILFPLAVKASVGDSLPEYEKCVVECESLVCSAKSPSPKFSSNSVNPIAKVLFGWDCYLDCGYKCQQLVTAERINHGEEVVQFFGKWPFVRVWGVTEIFSTLFSMGNFYVNYRNFLKLKHILRLNAKNQEKLIIYRQFQILVLVNMFGWVCSSAFHIRDTSLTETLDYLGAGAIVMANFNAVCVRFFNLHLAINRDRLKFFQYGLIFALSLHYLRLYVSWDYDYNMTFNVVIGLIAAGLWIAHSCLVYLKCQRGTLAKQATHLAPFEEKISSKLQVIGIYNTQWIPLIPVVLNLYLILAVSLELLDFVPWFLLIDAHSLWHMCTILPPIIWHDWNIWELELSTMDLRLP